MKIKNTDISLELKDKIINNILKECYWDYDIQKEHLYNIISSNDKREQQKLFSKIMYNAKDKLLALQLFKTNQLEELFDNFKVTYNKKYINKHVMILKYLLLGEIHHIKGLEWKKI
jgi:hypothetical protein